MASLDVESLYTNVPVSETIDIVLKHVYENSNIAPPKIPRQALRSLLEICTKKAPFKNINGDIYLQTDGLAMGGPLSCTLANFYMCEVENKIMGSLDNKPHLYARFVDDIFLEIDNENQLINLKNIFIQESKMNFTHEIGINNKLPYLDVLLDNSQRDKFLRSVYTKPTKMDECINFDCDAPDRYKIGVIKTLLNRAHKICNTDEALQNEIQRIKKLLVNNSFPNRLIDKITQEFKNKINSSSTTTRPDDHEELQSDPTTSDNNTQVSPPIEIFYQNQYHKLYKADEAALRKILKQHVFQINVKIKLCIYYKNKNIKDTVIKNNLSNSSVPHADKSHLVYEFTCPERECQSLNQSYIGLTSCTIRERFINHRNKGSIFAHYFKKHGGQKPDIDRMVAATKVLYHCENRNNLHIFEALFIRKFRPTLNENTSDFTCLSLNIY